MTGMFNGARDYAQNHPLTVAACLIFALPGSYFYLSSKPVSCAVGLCAQGASAITAESASSSNALPLYDSWHPLDLRLNLLTSRWSDRPLPAGIVQILQGLGAECIALLTRKAELFGHMEEELSRLLQGHWVSYLPFSRFASIAITSALPGAFLLFVHNHPGSLAALHQTKIANALHICALITVAYQKISVQEVLLVALFMVSLEVLQRARHHDTELMPSTVEILLPQTHSVVARSGMTINPEPSDVRDKDVQVDGGNSPLLDAKDEEIVRLQKALVEAKTGHIGKEHDLKRTKTELHNARETLNETFAEYSNLRDEVKTIKQTLSRDHQAVVYRKDIELFALRKANEQKENYIKERESKLESIYRQQRTALELKDAQIRNLKERVASLERQERLNGKTDIKPSVDGDHHAAVQVKLLRVKGRNSLEVERALEEKDAEITRLKLELADAVTATSGLEKTQDELRRAWDATHEVQRALNVERQQHAETHNKLQEAVLRLGQESKRGSQQTSPTTRLPTIEEQDKKELEAMFNTAQQDNLRLYAEVEALDKRVREANARVFTAEQETQVLREQLRLEKAINEDMESARPSIVHRVHFQRMEGELKESRDILAAKGEEIEQLKQQLEDAKRNTEVATTAQHQLWEETERLKQSIAQLEATKEQLMLDHERLAAHRARQRNSSGEQHHSARSSGATLITEPIIVSNEQEPMPPARPVSPPPSSSVQGTPERRFHDDSNRFSLISHDVPPPELRSSRRKSLTLKGLMRKMVRRDDEVPKERSRTDGEVKHDARPKTALAPKDHNALVRPKTAAVPVAKLEGKKEGERPKTAAVPAKSGVPRYYAEKPGTGDENAKPMTAATEGKGKEREKEANAGAEMGSPRPKSRGWSASRLVRRSVIG